MKLQYILVCTLALSNIVQAAMPEHDMTNHKMSGQDMTMMNNGNTKNDHTKMPDNQMSNSQMNMSDMNHGNMGQTSSLSLRNPDYSDGRTFGPIAPPVMMGNMKMTGVMLESLGLSVMDQEKAFVIDGEGWMGDDDRRVVLKLDAEKSKKDTSIDVQLAWRKPIAPFWNIDTGIAFDKMTNHSNHYSAAIGVNGLAPYWFKASATLLVNQHGKFNFKSKGSYDAKLTQRVTLEPMVDLNLSKEASNLGYGLRLRYEPKRRSSLYFGIMRTKELKQDMDLMETTDHRKSMFGFETGLMLMY